MRVTMLLLSLFLLTRESAAADLVLIQEQEQQQRGGVVKLTTVIKIKGEKVRIDNFLGDKPRSSSIKDHSSGQMIALFHDNKMYNIWTRSEVDEALKQSMASLQGGVTIPSERPTIKATGESQAINGWKAEKYIAVTDNGEMTYWIANELKPYHLEVQKALHNPGVAELERQFPDPALFPGMPVLIILEQSFSGMRSRTTFKTVSIKEEIIAESEFSIPQDYKKITELGKRNKKDAN